MSNNLEDTFGGQYNAFVAVFLVITGVLLLASWWVLTFVAGVAAPEERTTLEGQGLSPIYVNYETEVEEYVSAEAYIAMADYQTRYPMPRNAQVLEGLTTQEINGYMMNHFVAGLHVGCVYCHSLDNFAADEWGNADAEANKRNARRHLQMVQDLNTNWLTQLPDLTDQKQPSGAQITCATCHYGQAQWQVWPEEHPTLPDGFDLPLDEQYEFGLDTIGILNVTGRDAEISLDTVQYQQQIMYHMNESMNVGCTHCHNSRYFPSTEVPAIHYASNMLQMTQYIYQEYGVSLGGQEPSCAMCHNAAIIPPGSVKDRRFLPDVLVGPDPSAMADADSSMD